MATTNSSIESGGSRSNNGGLGGNTIVDPTTGKTLAADTIQRVLFIASKVHVYQVPPLRSTKGYTAAEWTHRPAIFEARLRIFETEEAAATPSSSPSPLSGSKTAGATTNPAPTGPVIRITIVLEDPSSGELFAAAPYNHPSAVSHCVDSSRFFAVRVVGEGGMRAVLGIGFEERPEAFDFGVALQDAAKVLGLDKHSSINSSAAAAVVGTGSRSAGRAGPGTNAARASSSSSFAPAVEGKKRDYSLKEGETIVVNIGSRRAVSSVPSVGGDVDYSDTLFSIKPPPPSSAPSASEGAITTSSFPLLAPPPTAEQVKREMRRGPSEDGDDNDDFTDFSTASTTTTTRTDAQTLSAQELGFDDGEFGEFQ